jgi:citrate lyase subunit beta / citryl-CoA lyase
MCEPAGSGVRISRATQAADLAAVVWPGVTTIYAPRAESAAQLQAVAERIAELERLRGIRPGTVGVVPLVETPLGVSLAHELAASHARISAFGVGPNIGAGLGVESDSAALSYARSECELTAKALGIEPVVIELVID